MVELMADVGVKLSLMFMYYNPRFFLYVPIDVKDKEGIIRELKLVMSDKAINPEIGPGFSLRDSEDNSLKYIGGPIDTIAYFYQDTDVDWEHLDERLGIAIRNLASMKLHHSRKIDASMGVNYSEDAMEVQRNLEEELMSRSDWEEHVTREDYLMKRVDTDSTEHEAPKLTLVKEEEEESEQ